MTSTTSRYAPACLFSSLSPLSSLRPPLSALLLLLLSALLLSCSPALVLLATYYAHLLLTTRDEQDAIMLEYAHQSLLSVLLAVLGAVLLLTMRLDTVALMGACTLSCVAHLLGWMHLVGISLR